MRTQKKAKDTSAAAERYNLLAAEKYGSRLFCSAIHVAVNKIFVYNISRQMKQPLAMCSNDARSCYDRIVHVAAFLVIRRLGIPKPMIMRMLNTIQLITHNICTSFGDSTATYGGTNWWLPPHRTIQGNGAFPIIWAEISTILFLAVRERNYGVRFCALLTKMLTSMADFVFVDDTDLLKTKHTHGDSKLSNQLYIKKYIYHRAAIAHKHNSRPQQL